MNETLNLTKMNGTGISPDLICYLEDEISSKRYVYYTLNETAGTGPSSTVKVYVAKIKQDDEVLDLPISEDEWGKLKGLMSDVLKGTPNTTIKYLPLSMLTNNTIVSEKVIAMPTSYDYINKHRGVYAETVATSDSSSADQVTPVVEPVAVNEPSETQVQAEPEVAVTPNESKPVIQQEVPNVEANTTLAEPVVPVTSVEMTPINISEIEAKYAEMINAINDLKNKEIEAANRYNATLELNAMHNEQHASYIASEQVKENPTSVIENSVDAQVNSSEQSALIMEPATQVEPAPVVPTTPEVASANGADVETNWFDMPAQ